MAGQQKEWDQADRLERALHFRPRTMATAPIRSRPASPGSGTEVAPPEVEEVPPEEEGIPPEDEEPPEEDEPPEEELEDEEELEEP